MQVYLASLWESTDSEEKYCPIKGSFSTQQVTLLVQFQITQDIIWEGAKALKVMNGQSQQWGVDTREQVFSKNDAYI